MTRMAFLREIEIMVPSILSRTDRHCKATAAAQRMGFDPTLGLMHSDKRYRPSLASDLMEPPWRSARAPELFTCFSCRTLPFCRIGFVERALSVSRSISRDLPTDSGNFGVQAALRSVFTFCTIGSKSAATGRSEAQKAGQES